MKKVYVRFYNQKNLGDDLFIEILTTRYLDHFSTGKLFYEKSFSPKNHLNNKIKSIVEVNNHILNYNFAENQKRHINAIHIRSIMGFLMIRASATWNVSVICTVMHTIATTKGVNDIYKNADMKRLKLYHRLVAWGVMSGNVAVVYALVMMRRIIRR